MTGVYVVDQGFAQDVSDRDFFINAHAAGSDVEVSSIGMDVRVKGL